MVHHVCVIGEHHCAPHPMELTVTKKTMSMSGESFTITDADGRMLFKMDGHALSIRDRCTLLDAEGRPIASARKKLRSMHERWEVVRGDNFDDENKLFYVKKTSLMQMKTHLEVYLGNKAEDDGVPDLEVKGNFFEREAQIFHGDALIAEIKRKYTVGNVLLDKHTFTTVVMPNVDQAFISTLVIIMDRIQDD